MFWVTASGRLFSTVSVRKVASASGPEGPEGGVRGVRDDGGRTSTDSLGPMRLSRGFGATTVTLLSVYHYGINR